MAQPVAFFDIDGTLFRSSLIVELVEQFVAKGIFPKSAEEQYRTELTAWLDRDGAYRDYIDAVVATFLAHIKGVHYGTFADAGKEIVAEHGRKVYTYTRDLLTELKAEGYYLVAISHSPKTLVDSFCIQYGFDKVYGHLYEIGEDDCLTGGYIDRHLIMDKANIVRRVFEKEDVREEDSTAVGDTEGDIPVLELVERPICFNPNALLYHHAQRTGWPVVVERKDVIYKL
jgi:HAD superfamily hydrolase (TIGR01490 family)